ncbi:MAG: hypothetical protein SFY81_08850 [Verrucomicrobiota bacterium]|nr:hypothetical protein [Verrucomicrobiota bacterium]
MQLLQIARHVREQFPENGLFDGKDWRVSTRPFPLGEKLAGELESLGRVLLQFYKASNLLYRHSLSGKQPSWVAEWLNRGKPAWLLELQQSAGFRNDLPRVIRPDILLTENGISITELDSVPGGIGLTAWLNQAYANAPSAGWAIIGGAEGMIEGFDSIFGKAPTVQMVISEESATYRPEMEWLTEQLNSHKGGRRFAVQYADFSGWKEGDAIYRFFELFDIANVPSALPIFKAAEQGQVTLTPPPKSFFEEKMLFALLWNRNLRQFWRQDLGDSFLRRLQSIVPQTWVMDPAPLPPQGAIPGLELTNWNELKNLSQKERDLIIKISGFSETAWGARSVSLGSDLSTAEWSDAVDRALKEFETRPYVLQRYHKPKSVPSYWFDFASNSEVEMAGRVRLCPYYFVKGEGDNARAQLCGVLATICPADKKIIHGMKDAVMAPCSV